MKLAISREGWLSGKETALGLLDHTQSSNAPPAGVPQKFGEGKWVLAQASSSSSDSGSELQGVSQNSSRVASKLRNVLDGHFRQWCYQTTVCATWAKINSEYYIQKILKSSLKDDYCRLYPNGDAVFHQDSAPSHASRVTQKFFTDQQVQFLRPQQWMPNSPDAAPCDYFLWGHLKNKLNKRRVSTLRGLQKAIREEVKKIPQEMILRALTSWPKRFRQIYYAEDRHIEKHR
ncbi:hypothetical protein AVEN_124373-1 [Araneus ventricosus]|uniref:Tc1-like transposase DDE domain-containing protein n=1 Tax=Araneus ventricosus TaxID=182803 RepID=A0A4Y2KYP5_ARAVE|nr:hypothetical protein AVEN_124373-1 [Araneus ventricosus]